MIMPKNEEINMQDEPTPTELIRAVAEFLRAEIALQVTGHAAFKLRYRSMRWTLVVRQLEFEQGSDAAEATRLSALLEMQGSLAELNRALADRIAKGEVDCKRRVSPITSGRPRWTSCGRSANYGSYKRELGRDSLPVMRAKRSNPGQQARTGLLPPSLFELRRRSRRKSSSQ